LEREKWEEHIRPVTFTFLSNLQYVNYCMFSFSIFWCILSFKNYFHMIPTAYES
jgi:hypothetical protein